MRFPEQEVMIDYTNYRGIRSMRRIQPLSLAYESNEYHPTKTWLLKAVDVDKGEVRTYALDEIRTWFPASSDRGGMGT